MKVLVLGWLSFVVHETHTSVANLDVLDVASDLNGLADDFVANTAS